MRPSLLALILLLPAPWPAATAQDALPTTGAEEELRLSDGASLRGRVLKETEEHLFVDVGFTVLEVPRGAVVGRAPAGAADRPAGGEVRRGLWSQAELPELSVKEAVARFAESVVQVKVPGALGSGFVVSDEGHVVTNAHVVQGEADVSIVLYPKVGDQIEKLTFEKVRILATNPEVDLALLQIDADELAQRPLRKVFLGNDDELRVGETVFAIGSPLGLERSVSEGVVSTTTRAIDGRVYLQVTAAINPGNSGGPLFNRKGEVVGVNSLKIMYSDGLGFSIPVGYVKHFLDNREAFAYDPEAPNSGYRYLQPPRRGKPQG